MSKKKWKLPIGSDTQKRQGDVMWIRDKRALTYLTVVARLIYYYYCLVALYLVEFEVVCFDLIDKADKTVGCNLRDYTDLLNPTNHTLWP